MMEFKLTRKPIVAEDPDLREAGGFVIFEGRVRRFNEGREVLAIEYEAFEPMALREGEKLLRDALAEHGVLEAVCVHRLGRLELGETAVRVAVAARHRREAFEACSAIIDGLKRDVPIWKKEFYADGESEWILNQDASFQKPDPEK
jgi:molybdopterin synthase catalytic subunit